jgi:hypothetical protein
MSNTAGDSLTVEDIPITTPVTSEKLEKDPSVTREDAIAGDAEQKYPSGPKFWLMVFALCLGGFLVSLVSHAPSIPNIRPHISRTGGSLLTLLFFLDRIVQSWQRQFLSSRMNFTHSGTLDGTAVYTSCLCACPSSPS